MTYVTFAGDWSWPCFWMWETCFRHSDCVQNQLPSSYGRGWPSLWSRCFASTQFRSSAGVPRSSWRCSWLWFARRLLACGSGSGSSLDWTSTARCSPSHTSKSWTTSHRWSHLSKRVQARTSCRGSLLGLRPFAPHLLPKHWQHWLALSVSSRWPPLEKF